MKNQRFALEALTWLLFEVKILPELYKKIDIGKYGLNVFRDHNPRRFVNEIMTKVDDAQATGKDSSQVFAVIMQELLKRYSRCSNKEYMNKPDLFVDHLNNKKDRDSHMTRLVGLLIQEAHKKYENEFMAGVSNEYLPFYVSVLKIEPGSQYNKIRDTIPSA